MGPAQAGYCPDAVIRQTCATATVSRCTDAHGNTCIVCSGGSPGCLYDPQAPADGGNAACVEQCSDCGADCHPID
jgi:hypothetical protein